MPLKKSYAAAMQFQSQISSVKNFQELKELANHLDVAVFTHILSSNVWDLFIDLKKGRISGTIEVWLRPHIRVGMDIFETRSQSLRLEMPNQMSLDSFEKNFLDTVKDSISSLSFDQSFRELNN